MNQSLTKMVGTHLEANGQKLSEDALYVYCKPFLNQELDSVEKALEQCILSCKGFIRPVDIIERMEFSDGRPSATEAWHMMPFDERQTAVWTDEMKECLEFSDYPRFQRAYEQLVKQARLSGEPVNWSVSLGWDRQARQPVIDEAYRLGRLGSSDVKRLGYEVQGGEII